MLAASGFTSALSAVERKMKRDRKRPKDEGGGQVKILRESFVFFPFSLDVLFTLCIQFQPPFHNHKLWDVMRKFSFRWLWLFQNVCMKEAKKKHTRRKSFFMHTHPPSLSHVFYKSRRAIMIHQKSEEKSPRKWYVAGYMNLWKFLNLFHVIMPP